MTHSESRSGLIWRYALNPTSGRVKNALWMLWLSWKFCSSFSLPTLSSYTLGVQIHHIPLHLRYTVDTKGMPIYLIMPSFAVFGVFFNKGLIAKKVCLHRSKALGLLVSQNFLCWNSNFRACFNNEAWSPIRSSVLLAPFLVRHTEHSLH